MGKETLGFPSRTAAVVALRKQGRSTREIAGLVGIEPKTVTALEASSSRTDTARHKDLSTPAGTLPIGVRMKLRRPAMQRGVSVDRLVLMILDAVVDGNLVDAVLDDLEKAG